MQNSINPDVISELPAHLKKALRLIENLNQNKRGPKPIPIIPDRTNQVDLIGVTYPATTWEKFLRFPNLKLAKLAVAARKKGQDEIELYNYRFKVGNRGKLTLIKLPKRFDLLLLKKLGQKLDLEKIKEDNLDADYDPNNPLKFWLKE